MQKLTLPKAGQGMTEGTVVEWNVAVGEAIEAGEPVLHFETEKMVSEITAAEAGTLLERNVDAGETVAVGTVLGYLGEPGETPPSDGATEGDGPAAESMDEPSTEVDSDIIGDVEPAEQVRATPTARRKAREQGLSLEEVAGTLGISKVTPADIEAFAEARSGTDARASEDRSIQAEEVLGSPRAGVVASKAGVEIASVGRALGISRVREADVHEYVESMSTDQVRAGQEGSISRVEPAIRDDHRLVGSETVMFDQMSRVAESYASTTTVARVDVTELLDVYEQVKESWSRQDDPVSLTAFVARAIASTISEYPRLNAEYLPAEESLRTYADVNLGVAVNSSDGLIVPTIYGADRRSVRDLSSELEGLVAKAENRKLEEADLRNATVSLSNAGSLGAYMNTPQINPPQTSIVGMCKIFEDAGVVDGQVVPRKYMHLCLSYDHRVVEGATAVRFLQEVKAKLEAPTGLLS